MNYSSPITIEYLSDKKVNENPQTVYNAVSVVKTLLQLGFDKNQFKDIVIEGPLKGTEGSTHVFIRLKNNFEVVLKDASLNVGFKSTLGKVKNWHSKFSEICEINTSRWSSHDNSRVEVECSTLNSTISTSKKLLQLSYKLK